MAPRTTTKATKQTKAPSDPLEAQLPPDETDEAEWATREDAKPEPWTDVLLPKMGKKVRIRFLGNIEAASLAFLPDLGFAGVMLDVLQSDEKMDREEIQAKLAGQEKNRAQYMVRIAHMCIVDRAEPFVVRPCADCGIDHQPPLWSMAQADILDLDDLMFITRTAEQEEAMLGIRPFSPEMMLPSSDPSAATGESTPPTSS